MCNYHVRVHLKYVPRLKHWSSASFADCFTTIVFFKQIMCRIKRPACCVQIPCRLSSVSCVAGGTEHFKCIWNIYIYFWMAGWHFRGLQETPAEAVWREWLGEGFSAGRKIWHHSSHFKYAFALRLIHIVNHFTACIKLPKSTFQQTNISFTIFINIFFKNVSYVLMCDLCSCICKYWCHLISLEMLRQSYQIWWIG